MNIWGRYQRLTIWNKLGAWSAVATIVGVVYSIFPGEKPSPNPLLESVSTDGSRDVAFGEGKATIIQGTTIQGDLVLDGEEKNPLSTIDDEALVVEARHFLSGDDRAKNFAKARELIDEGVRRGVPTALNLYGILLFNGNVYEKDTKKAMFLWEQAAQLGLEQAAFNLGEAHYHLLGGDSAKNGPLFLQYGMHNALHWFIVAAESGHEEAMVRVNGDWSNAAITMLKQDFPGDVEKFQKLRAGK